MPVRRVRTPEGARFYSAPIGTPIVMDKVSKKFRASTARLGPSKAKVPKSFLAQIIQAGKDGGFTADLRSDQFKATGFAVARPGQGEHFKVDAPDVEERLDAYIDKHWDDLSTDPEVFLGGWVDNDTGEIWLDITEVTDDPQRAYDRAKQRGEIAIADLAKYAAGQDGEIRIKYEKRPPKGTPAYDDWSSG